MCFLYPPPSPPSPLPTPRTKRCCRLSNSADAFSLSFPPTFNFYFFLNVRRIGRMPSGRNDGLRERDGEIRETDLWREHRGNEQRRWIDGIVGDGRRGRGTFSSGDTTTEATTTTTTTATATPPTLPTTLRKAWKRRGRGHGGRAGGGTTGN